MINKRLGTVLAIIFFVAIICPMETANPSLAQVEVNDSEGMNFSSEHEKIDVLIGFHREPGDIEVNMVEAVNGDIFWQFNIIDVVAATMSPHDARELAKNPAVDYVEPDKPVYILEQRVPWGIDRVFDDESYPFESWDLKAGDDIGVAILDTGIDLEHEDLSVLGGTNTIGGTTYTDGHGHGTHVAGTVAALDNEVGVVGVGPDLGLYAVKVLDNMGRGTWFSVAAGIEWAVEQDIPVINMSLGGEHGRTLRDACDAAYSAGHLLVAAAGNSGNYEGTGNNVSYPAGYDSVIAVAASDVRDRRASFSSTGPAVELIAPGQGILSTWTYNRYISINGTSMASPHVAGSAALTWTANLDLTNAEVRELLQQTAEDLTLPQSHQGHGMVRADLAVREAWETTQPANGTIAGTVVNKQGEAIAGATVTVAGTDLSDETGAQGEYRLEEVPVGEQEVVVSADFYASETATVTVEENTAVTRDFVLSRLTGTIAGTVVNELGEAIAGATVAVAGTGLSDETGTQGEYRLEEVPVGEQEVVVSADFYASETAIATVEENTAVTLDFVLPRSGIIYKITATAEEGGEIKPSPAVSVYEGESQTFTVIPNSDYLIKGVLVDDQSVGAVESYTFEQVTSNHTIHAAFEALPAYYTVSGVVTSSEGGALEGATVTIKGTGHSAVTEAGGTYTLADVKEGSYKISADKEGYSNETREIAVESDLDNVDFTLPKIKAVYEITATAGSGGEIKPSATVAVVEGESQPFLVVPDRGYRIEDVLVDGESAGAVDCYTFEDVSDHHTIHALFETVPAYTVSGSVTDNRGEALEGATVTIVETGQVAVTDAGGSYTLAGIEEGSYKISAGKEDYNYETRTVAVESDLDNVDFSLQKIGKEVYTITATAGAGGEIIPSAAVAVYEGESQTFIVFPKQGFRTDQVLVDDEPVGAFYCYTFKDVKDNHTIHASFAASSVHNRLGIFSFLNRGSYNDAEIQETGPAAGTGADDTDKLADLKQAISGIIPTRRSGEQARSSP